MKRILFPTVLAMLLINLCSCGPNAAELAKMQQHREDSIKASTQRRYVVATEMRNTQEALGSLTSQLKKAEAQLETENARQKSAGKERQQSASTTIQALKDNIASIQKNISESQERIQALNIEERQYQ